MLDKWKAWFKNNYVVVVLVGILILIMLIPVGGDEDESIGEAQTRQEVNFSNAYMGDTLDATQTYCHLLEEKMELLLSKIEGVGKTEVMITMQYSEEKYIEKENSNQIQETVETDASGGTRKVYSTSEENGTVYESIDNNSIPYVIKTQVPKVQGVFVVAQGAGVGEVDLKITQIVQALLGIDVHKIAIAKMETQ